MRCVLVFEYETWFMPPVLRSPQRTRSSSDHEPKEFQPAPKCFEALPVVKETSLYRRFPSSALAATFLGCLGLVSLHPRVQVNLRLAESVWGATLLLLTTLFIVQLFARRGRRTLDYMFVPVKAHYVQLMMHASIYLYWGWYWRHVYHFWPLLVIQVLFVYVLDMCLCWSRRDTWVLGLGAFPIVLSINLFLSFKDDWFFLQFVMLALAVLCKEFLKWTRDGRRTHIFNPSGIALCIMSVGLLLTKTTYLTWGETIANTFRRPPHIYLELFLLGLVVQALFSVTRVTLSAAFVLYVLNLFFTRATGMYYFFDSGISVSAFLGLHLLVTDPATSPRTSIGKLIFGGLYGAGIFVTYGVLGWLSMPQFYDKLLCLPLLNLSVRLLDRKGEVLADWLDRRVRLPNWNWREWNLAYMSAWACLFTTMMTTGFLSIPHPGEKAEVWQKPCENANGTACRLWEYLLRSDCDRGSGESCFKLGRALTMGYPLPPKPVVAGEALLRACNLGLQTGCVAAAQFLHAGGEQTLLDACYRSDNISCVTLGALYRAGTMAPKNEERSLQFFGRACAGRWSPACGQIAQAYLRGQTVPKDADKASEYFKVACDGADAPSCVALARLEVDPLVRDRRLRRACSLGLESACGSNENPN
jgi:hypothetical protein